ncbi:MAG: EAL domain-containing protein [Clostridia bacterium]|nr:EAL domain-containing protein [Clostridia bacterium]
MYEFDEKELSGDRFEDYRVVHFQKGKTNRKLDRDLISEANNLTKAIENNRLVLFFQPVINIVSGEIIYHEALMRIIDERGEIIYPDKTIAVAERFGLMPLIDRQVIKAAFAALEKYPRLKLFVNLSGSSIGDEGLLELIEGKLAETGVDPSRLGFEITETKAVMDLVRANRWINRLRARGCKFALDDFGMGFSSFYYLIFLSLDYVKIDGSFIKDIDKNLESRALVQGMKTAVASLGIEVVAEYVENNDVLEVLKKERLFNVQGFFLGRPEPEPVFINA